MRHSTDILKEYGIRQTDCRNAVLFTFLSEERALSQPDLEKAIGDDHDRVTIYRSLSLFLEKGILHKVLDDEGAMKYALCTDHCHEGDHHHDHVHFKCTQCGATLCFDQIEAPRFRLPEGYKVEEVNLLLSGVCRECLRGN